MNDSPSLAAYRLGQRSPSPFRRERLLWLLLVLVLCVVHASAVTVHFSNQNDAVVEWHLEGALPSPDWRGAGMRFPVPARTTLTVTIPPTPYLTLTTAGSVGSGWVRPLYDLLPDDVVYAESWDSDTSSDAVRLGALPKADPWTPHVVALLIVLSAVAVIAVALRMNHHEN